MKIRAERPPDRQSIRAVHVEAFGQREEADLVERIRADRWFIPELSLVAESDGGIVGHILFSKIEVADGDRKTDALALAPMAVLPDYQRRGIGSRLVVEGLRKCGEFHFPAVIVIGHPDFYPKFGFKPARPLGLECRQYDAADEVFMVYDVHPALHRPKGIVVYPETFDGV